MACAAFHGTRLSACGRLRTRQSRTADIPLQGSRVPAVTTAGAPSASRVSLAPHDSRGSSTCRGRRPERRTRNPAQQASSSGPSRLARQSAHGEVDRTLQAMEVPTADNFEIAKSERPGTWLGRTNVVGTARRSGVGLVTRFYEELFIGNRSTQALRRAQLWRRDLNEAEENTFLAAHPALEKESRRRAGQGRRPGLRSATTWKPQCPSSGHTPTPEYRAAFILAGR
jgi:hypothetical protein